MTEKDIKELLLHGERLTLECKEAQSAVPKSTWETYSAFANTIGGTILLGVTEDLKEKDLAKRYSITGVEDKIKMIKSFWDTINSSKVNVNILLDSDVQPLNVDGKDIIVITVPHFEVAIVQDY